MHYDTEIERYKETIRNLQAALEEKEEQEASIIGRVSPILTNVIEGLATKYLLGANAISTQPTQTMPISGTPAESKTAVDITEEQEEAVNEAVAKIIQRAGDNGINALVKLSVAPEDKFQMALGLVTMHL